jgi:hypothetical protein
MISQQISPSNKSVTLAPAFVLKTYAIIEDPKTDPYIRWTAAGDSFIVSDVEGFQSQVLARNFNHSNFCSFVRQLHLYGFHKLNSDPATNTFCFGDQPLFHRDKPHLLSQIKRRSSAKTKRKNDPGDPTTYERDPLIPDLQVLSSAHEQEPEAAAEPSTFFAVPSVESSRSLEAGSDALTHIPTEQLISMVSQLSSELSLLKSELQHTRKENKRLKQQLADIRELALGHHQSETPPTEGFFTAASPPEQQQPDRDAETLSLPPPADHSKLFDSATLNVDTWLDLTNLQLSPLHDDALLAEKPFNPDDLISEMFDSFSFQ